MKISHYSKEALIALCTVSCIMATGCMTAGQHVTDLGSRQGERLTVGLVQKRISRGMSQAEVAEALGSPNIVTKDAAGAETWIFDRIATEASYSTDSGGAEGLVGAGGLPGAALILGGVGGNYHKSAGAASSSQRTLTVIIKFDQRSHVQDFSYHASSF